MPGGSGVFELANLNQFTLERLIHSLENLDGQFDYVLIDTIRAWLSCDKFYSGRSSSCSNYN